MKNLFLAAVAGLALSTAAAQAQPAMEVDVTAPADADVTITTQETMPAPQAPQYNNADMQNLPSTPGVEVESVQEAMTPPLAPETDIQIEEDISVMQPK